MEINIYIANLGKYNEGQLVGQWVTLPVTEEELNDVYVRIKLGYYNDSGVYVHGFREGHSYYEEMAIHDYEAPFKINEYDSINNLNDLARQLSELSDEEAKIVTAIVNDGVFDFDNAIEKLSDGSVVIWQENSMEAIAEISYVEDGVIEEDNPLYDYINWESVARDMQINGTWIEAEHNLWAEVTY